MGDMVSSSSVLGDSVAQFVDQYFSAVIQFHISGSFSQSGSGVGLNKDE